MTTWIGYGRYRITWTENEKGDEMAYWIVRAGDFSPAQEQAGVIGEIVAKAKTLATAKKKAFRGEMIFSILPRYESHFPHIGGYLLDRDIYHYWGKGCGSIRIKPKIRKKLT